MKTIRFLILFLTVLSACETVQAAGISISFGDIRIENLQIGQVYQGSKDIIHNLYSVRNKMDVPLDFKIEAAVPQENLLVKGYEPIPDQSWIIIANPFLSAGPGEKAETEFYISIPNDPAYLGKKYQVMLGAHTVGKDLVQLGLSGRICFSISGEPAPSNDRKLKSRRYGLRLRCEPRYAEAEITAGKKSELKNILKQPFCIQNEEQYPVQLNVRHVLLKESFVNPPAGYLQCPDVSCLKLSDVKIILNPGEKKQLNGYVKIPGKSKYRDKSFYFVVEIENIINTAYHPKKYIYLLVKTNE